MVSVPPLARRVLLTLGYADQFEYPLTFTEIWLRLVGAKRWSALALTRAVVWLVSAGLIRIERRGDVRYIQLSNRFGLSAQRLAHSRFSEQKMYELQPLLRFVRFLPWVVGVAVTGSVAVKNAQLVDDTDLLIVVRTGSLWLVRPVLIVFAWLHGKRRSWRAEEKESWCFNLWMEPSQLSVPVNMRSVYTAHEVLQAHWVFDSLGIELSFLSENSWVRQILPHWYAHHSAQALGGSGQTVSSWVTEFLLVGTKPIWWVCNILLYVVQRLYMHPHKTRERVVLSAAYFHPRDTRVTTNSGWRQSVLQSLSEPNLPKQLQEAGKLPSAIAEQLQQVRVAGGKIVLATGVFDVLHEEHVTFLEKAAQLGDFLLIGVESDERVRQIKGASRPVFPAKIRAQQVFAVRSVDAVVVLPSRFGTPGEHAAFLHVVLPAFFAVSANSMHLDKKRTAVEAVGGQLSIVHEYNPEVSSTQLLADQASSRVV